MEQVKISNGDNDLFIQHSRTVSISTSNFIDNEGKQVILAIGQFPVGEEVHEVKCGRVYDSPDSAIDGNEVFSAMKREVLRELVTHLQLQGVL